MTGPLHVEAVGEGPPIVLLHGWAMHGGIWGPWLHRLAARHRLYVVDLPGHGHSAGVSLSSLDDAVGKVVAALPGGPAVVAGWSLGALVALQWARMHPDAVSRLVLLSSTPRFVAAADWPHGVAESVLVRFGDELAAAYRLTLQRFLTLQLQGTDDGRRVLASMRGALFSRGEPPREALAAGLALLRHADLRRGLAQIAQPALVVCGERDTLCPPGASRWLAQALLQARLVSLPGAGHAPFLSHPDAVADAVTAFVDEP